MKCPACGEKKKLIRHRQRLYTCGRCKQPFDPVSDGDYHVDPTKRLRLKEAGHERRRHLKGGL